MSPEASLALLSRRSLVFLGATLVNKVSPILIGLLIEDFNQVGAGKAGVHLFHFEQSR